MHITLSEKKSQSEKATMLLLDILKKAVKRLVVARGLGEVRDDRGFLEQ